MADSSQLLAVVQLLNTLLGLSKQLSVNFTGLGKYLDELSAEGKDLSAEELAAYVAETRTELDGLEADLEARKAGIPIL